MVSSCNVKNVDNPTCCPDAQDVGEGENYIIRCIQADRIVDGQTDRFLFP
jgi:hypothetical protein